MKLHPRAVPVTEAETELRWAVVEIGKKYNLTLAETIDVLARLTATHAGWAVKYERDAVVNLRRLT